MTQTVSPLIVHLTYRKPGRVRVALAMVAFGVAAGFQWLSTAILTAGLLKVESPS